MSTPRVIVLLILTMACGRTHLDDAEEGAAGNDAGARDAARDGGNKTETDHGHAPKPDAAAPVTVACAGAGGGQCPAGTMCCAECAFSPPPPKCVPERECAGIAFQCDGPEDCPGAFCCPPKDSCRGTVKCADFCDSGAYCRVDADCPPRRHCCGAGPVRPGFCREAC